MPSRNVAIPSGKPASNCEPVPPARDRVAPADDHVVQFYEDEGYLLDTIAEFVREGLRAGDPVLVVTAHASRPELRTRLVAFGVEAEADEVRERFRLVDSREALASFMEEGEPDRERFRALVGGILDALEAAPRVGGGDGGGRRGEGRERAGNGRTGARPRVFGDMVDVLCQEGKAEAAARLEDLWNELAHERPFSLLCAYSLDGFRRKADAEPFVELCAQHARVIPAESYLRLGLQEERDREVGRLQQQARALGSELEIVNRMKDEFLAVLSHELRTPLSAILGWVEVVNELPRETAPIGRALDAIQRNALHQLHLIEDLLDVSRIITGNMQVRMQNVRLREVAEGAAASVRPAAEAKSIDLELRPADALPAIRGDAERLQQVIWNLLSNAVKFTPRAGRVELALEADDDEVRIEVRDNGQGIDPEFLPHVFDRFRQADGGHTRRHSGLGLGLAVARHLVEAHGGTLTAESPGEGFGATFTIRLPLPARAAA